MRLYRPLLWKAYFDKGFSITNYFKYVIAFFGLASLDVKLTMIIAGCYAFACLIIGRLWFHFRLIDTEQEILNIFNPFQREVRHYMNNEKFINK